MEALQTAPETSTFVPLAEYQSQTPSSFHSGPPVLHYHSQRCKVVILERDLIATPALNALRGSQSSTNGATDAQGSEDGEGNEVAIDGVETWVTSDKFLLYSSTAQAGLSIPYPSISLHAIQRLRVPGSDAEVQGLYMQIATPDAPTTDEEEEPCITLTLVPPTEPGAVGDSTASAAATTSTAGERATRDLSDEPEETPTQMLYNAVSACSNLHPDPVQPGDEDDQDEEGKFMFSEAYGTVLGEAGGEMPPAMPGSSGWITVENMHEFFDEEGNPLGPGAGTVRARDEENGDEADGEADETKWRRTD